METIRIDILNPKAKKLLKDLMDLKLIRISEEGSSTENTVKEPSSAYRGKEVKAILDELAKKHGFSDIEDPTDWQRNERKDRKFD
ncbi:MAG: hypothetical protein GC178_13930 [Flavobacteriales bacterium]|nr:hypothetical protein [Flavobacteriales bacterium]